MAQRRWGSLLAIAAVVAASAPAGDSSPGASNPSSPYTFVEVGQVLGPNDLGLAPGGNRGAADPSAIRLPDGRIRVYFGLVDEPGANGPGKIGSAISSDGVHFAIEQGLRLEGSRPFVFRLPDGRYRLFSNNCLPSGPPDCGVVSATSSDGLTFVVDPGLRIQHFSPFFPGGLPVCSAIVKLADERYRMYCSQQVTPDPQMGPRAIFSAVSSDLLTWTPEPGIRIGPGAPTLTGDADHPTAVATPDGSVALAYYWRSPEGEREYIATSKDGLMFDANAYTGINGSEPSFASGSDGSLLLYYGYHRDSNTIHVAGVVANRLLTVTVRGHGSVASTPLGIACPATCTATLPDGQAVTLRARPSRTYVFAGWSGGCTGHGRCSLRMHADKSVGAHFVRAVAACKKGQSGTQKHPCRRS